MAAAGWFVLLGAALILSGVLVMIITRRIREIEWYRCPRCGYTLDTQPRQRCPECGTELERQDLEPPTEERRSIWTATGACLLFIGLWIGLIGALGFVG